MVRDNAHPIYLPLASTMSSLWRIQSRLPIRQRLPLFAFGEPTSFGKASSNWKGFFLFLLAFFFFASPSLFPAMYTQNVMRGVVARTLLLTREDSGYHALRVSPAEFHPFMKLWDEATILFNLGEFSWHIAEDSRCFGGFIVELWARDIFWASIDCFLDWNGWRKRKVKQ